MRAGPTPILLLLTACAVPPPPPAVPAPARPPPAAAAAPVPAPEAAAPREVAALSEPPAAPDPGAPSTALRLHGGLDLAMVAPLTPVTVGAEPHVPGPTVAFGQVLATAELADAALVVAGLRNGFKSCYNRALSDDPKLVGFVALGLGVGADGSVTSVAVAKAEGVESALIACVRRVASGAQFSRPKGGSAALIVPMTFVQQ